MPPRRGPRGEWIYWISRIWSGISPAARQSYCTWCQMALWCRRPCIGGTSDISAGQLIDRTGKKLGLPFPGGESGGRAVSSGPGQDALPCKSFGLHLFFLRNREQNERIGGGRYAAGRGLLVVLSSIIQGWKPPHSKRWCAIRGFPSSAQEGWLPISCCGRG